MSDLPSETPLEPITSHSHLNAPAAFDPTAKIEGEESDSISSPIGSSFRLKTWFHHPIRFYLVKTISLIMIVHGLIYLYEKVEEIFFIFPKLPALFATLDYSRDLYQSLIYKTLIVTTTSFVETFFGVFLATKKSHLVHNLHLVVAVVMFVASYVLLKVIAPLDLSHLEEYGLASLLHYPLS